MQYVPVVDRNNHPLMPTTANRAQAWIQSGKATPFWRRGLFCLRLNVEPSARHRQPIVVGIDPGSKKEAFTVKSEAHTYIHIQADAVTWVKEHIETRRIMRRSRRYRKTPYRPMRANRHQGQFRLPPSTRARWGWKLRIVTWLRRLYPIAHAVVEDIQAWTRAGQRRWNASFSPLEVGKQWFYAELGKLVGVSLLKGHETAEARTGFGLVKSRAKLSDAFEAHCVDSWTLANVWIGGHTAPDNTVVLYVVPLRFHRRQLHRLQPEKGSIRKPYGSTNSLGLKRGSWVKHPQWGVCYVGGTTSGRISLHSLQDGRRLTKVKPDTVQLLTGSSWRLRKEKSDNPPPR